jgi:hypothetical protein
MFVKANEVERGSVIDVIYNLDGILVASCENEPDVLMERLTQILETLHEKILEERNKKNANNGVRY